METYLNEGPCCEALGGGIGIDPAIDPVVEIAEVEAMPADAVDAAAMAEAEAAVSVTKASVAGTISKRVH